MRTIPDHSPFKALVLAPLGRDSIVASRLLDGAAISSVVCRTLHELHERLNEDICFVVVADEAMHAADLRPLSSWLNAQPTWSDLPFIILTHHSDTAMPPETQRLSELLGNVTLIERPFHPLTFLSVTRTAYKGRLRQYEARARIDELRLSEEDLERRVAERTAELNRAHAAVLEQIEQRERAEEKLRQSQKMEMIGQLTGGVAHDFNNLLMAVLGNLDLLRKRAQSDPMALRLIDGAMQGAQRGAALTQRLLAFARRQDLKAEPTNLCQLVRGMRDLIERSIGREIELVMDIADGLPRVMIDANQVELAVLNLVVNARDAMPNGGKITLAIDQAIPDETLSLPSGPFVRLAVTDTGIGMDDETLRKATEPFFSTKELGKGTGLGLSMIHGLARQLDGAFRLTSVVGQGTTAEFWMPATSRPIAVRAAHMQVPAPQPISKLTVLVVDDDALILMSTGLMVEDLGYQALQSTSGNQAIQILQSGRHIDLLITDFSMPRMNGVQLGLAARELRPGLPVLLATGYAEIPGGLDPGFPRIGKPYQQEQLAAAIAGAIQGAPAAARHVG